VKRRKWVAATAVVAVTGAFALVGAAAGGTAGAAGSSGGSVRGVTSTSITVAGISQAEQFPGSDMETGAKAAFALVNAKGGVYGRKINYVESADDQGSVSVDLSQVQRLVEQDQVFALVPVLDPFLDEAGPYLEAQKVPFFGWGVDHAFCDNPYAFAFTGCIVPPPNIPTTGTTWGALLNAYFKANGSPGGSKGKTAAVISEDNATGISGAQVIEAQVKKAGFKSVYLQHTLPAPPAVVGDYTPFVQAMMTSANGQQPDAIFLVTTVNNTEKLVSALPAAGYKGVLTNAVLYDPRAVGLTKDNFEFTQFDTPVDTTNPAMNQIVANIKAVGGPNVVITQGMLSAYFSADAFVKVLQKTGKNLTPETFAAVMKNFTYQIPGVVGPTVYPEAETEGSPCGSLIGSNGTTFSIAVKYTCYQDFNYKTGKFLKF
jgi:ABC-type branched-subunit amino acid transport system substrate-binding protein